MKYPNCDKEIAKFDDICPNCKIDLFEYKKGNVNIKNNTEETSGLTKTTLLKWINILQIFGLIIAAFISCQNGNGFQDLMYFIIGIISFAFIKGFTDIIDLLDSINDKLNK